MRRGYVLIEIIISIMILVIGMTIVLEGYSSINKAIRERTINRMLEDDLYSICMEIRYNEPLLTIKDNLIDGELYIEYNDKFSDTIKIKNLFDIDEVGKDNYIKISKLSESNNGIKVNVSIKYKEFFVSSDVLKDEWMDE